ncbi:MAG TPA: PfkB family carbohydrate kinase [Hyphomicrobiaceae bacterium]|nr:PfkB family carbohydrate kinase [Hyphomicrobiaceae bacterium]
MARILALSSMVARGCVGLSAIVPALHRLGHEVIALPTVLLSNHLGHARAAGMEVPADKLAQIIDALDGNGWLGELDAVLTGYLPSPGHVRLAVAAIERVRSHRAAARVFCDPVLGDDPKGLYLDETAAATLRDELVPRADTLTPNRFELAWLSGRPVEDARSAIEAARRLPVAVTLATSVPAPGATIANLLISASRCYRCLVPRLEAVPHGTGDFMTALFAGYCLKGGTGAGPLAAATAGVAAAIAASHGKDELELAASQDAWSGAPPLPVDEL